jgi:hypothetical protein
VPGGVAWSAGRIAASVSLWHPATLRIAVHGQQRLRVSHAPEITFSADRMTASVPLWTAHPDQAELQADAIAGGLAGSGHPDDVQIDALRLLLRSAAAPPPRDGGKAGLAASLTVSMHGIGLPDTRQWALGGTIASAGGTLMLATPDMPFWDTQAAPLGPPQAQAEAWRDGGGVLRVRDLHLRWGPLTLQGDADLGLDGRLQPAGSGTADVTGLAAALDALVGSGLITPGLAATFKAVAAPMAHGPAPGADPAPTDRLRLPFVLHDNTLAVGEIPLAHLNDIAWQHPPSKPQ